MKMNKVFKATKGHIYTFFAKMYFAADKEANKEGIKGNRELASFWRGYRTAMVDFMYATEYGTDGICKDVFETGLASFKEWLELRGELEKFCGKS